MKFKIPANANTKTSIHFHSMPDISSFQGGGLGEDKSTLEEKGSIERENQEEANSQTYYFILWTLATPRPRLRRVHQKMWLVTPGLYSLNIEITWVPNCLYTSLNFRFFRKQGNLPPHLFLKL